LQSVCAKITSSRTIAMERRSAQKLHSSAIAWLQIFQLFFAGSRSQTKPTPAWILVSFPDQTNPSVDLSLVPRPNQPQRGFVFLAILLVLHKFLQRAQKGDKSPDPPSLCDAGSDQRGGWLGMGC